MIDVLHLNNWTTNHLGIGIFKYQLSPYPQMVTVNNALVKIYGATNRKGIEEQGLDYLITIPQDRKEFLSQIKKNGKVEFFETTRTTKEGKIVWLAISACLIEENPRQRYIEGIVQDISNYKKETNELNQEIHVLQGFLDSMPDAIYFKDQKNRITRVNKFYADGFNEKQENLLGKTDFDFFPETQARGMFEDDNSILKSGKPIIGKIERTLLPNGEWNQVITTKVPMYDQLGKIVGTMGITRDMTTHANLERERFTMILHALEVLGKALEMRDPYTYSHTRYVAKISQQIAQRLNFSGDHIMQIKLAAELHDLGKISIPLDILIKPGRLTDLEFEMVKMHVDNCYTLIKDIEFPFPLAEIIYQHHERLDGTGYPRKLKGKEILIEARILAVSDVLEAMTSHRPYRESLGVKKAIAEIQRGRGSCYDPNVVDAAMQLIKENDGKPFWQGQES